MPCPSGSRLGAGYGLDRGLVSLPVPDLLVVARFAARAKTQHNAVEDELPNETLVLDHAGVGEKLFEVAPHRGWVGRVRCAEIDQQHTDFAGGGGLAAGCLGFERCRYHFIHGPSIRDSAPPCMRAKPVARDLKRARCPCFACLRSCWRSSTPALRLMQRRRA